MWIQMQKEATELSDFEELGTGMGAESAGGMGKVKVEGDEQK